MWKWVYPFLYRHRLSIRRKTRKLSGHLQKIRSEFVAALNERFKAGSTLEGTPSSLRVNMDETAVFFEMTSDTTINEVNAQTVSIRGSGSIAKRLTACISCVQDGTKLPLFVVFKAKAGATIEKENGWMDECGCQIWFNKVWKPYAASYPSSLLFLDEFKCHIQSSFIQTLNSIETEPEIIPGGYTCVLQPCDVGINKPLKDGIRAQYNDWAVRKWTSLLLALKYLRRNVKISLHSWCLHGMQ
ncbi:Pogo transposable element [Phytophthora megakarya]|uniref:Pogo transposable element n=1 Tax=Phytophthora megakarya TaxID=4795 RepID=A0A225UIW6_9STRA|nr:Pogo transposable element [Phytophthora megakarya]